MFGDKKLIMNNKLFSKMRELEEEDIEKEYEIELNYRATVTSSLRGKTTIKTKAKTEDEATENAQDILYENIKDNMDETDIEDVDIDLDNVETRVLKVISCESIKDTKTIDMFKQRR